MTAGADGAAGRVSDAFAAGDSAALLPTARGSTFTRMILSTAKRAAVPRGVHVAVPSLVRSGVLLSALALAHASVSAQTAGEASDRPHPDSLSAPALPVVWSASITEGASAPPLVADGRLYIAALHQDVFAFEASTGRELWKRRLARGFQASPALAGGLVVAVSPHPTARAYALDAATGESRWEARVGDVAQPPLVSAGRLIFVSMGGRIRALDESGEQLWESRLEGVFPGGSLLLGSDLILLSASGLLYRLDAATGRRIGTADLGAPAAPGLASLSGGAGFVAATYSGRVRAFAPDLTPLPLGLTTRPLQEPPVVAGTRLLVPGADRVLRAFDLESGAPLWERRLPVTLSTSPTVAPDAARAAVGDLAGSVWTIDLASGTVLSRNTLADAAAVPAWTQLGIVVVTRSESVTLLGASAAPGGVSSLPSAPAGRSPPSPPP